MRRAKGRMIRKAISQSKKLASLSKESLILFYMIIPHLNSFGKINGSPHYIKGEVVPLMAWFTIPQIEKSLKEISEKTNLKWFKNNDLYYLHSLSWEHHQDLEVNKRGHDDMPSFCLIADNSPITLEQVPHKVEVEVEVEVKDKDKDKCLFGEFQNVKLTEQEYQKLLSKFQEEKTKELIERLSTGIASKGYKYKNHYATILNWERKKEQEKPKTWRDLKYD